MRHTAILIIATTLICAQPAAWAGTPALLELEQKGKAYCGKLLAHTKDQCWLVGRDGQLSRLRFEDVDKYRRVSPRFERFSPAELRDRLRRELGAGYEAVGTEHYLVCASRGRAQEYSRVFEDIYRQFYVYFSRRGLPISKPEFPLVAIVLPSQESFCDYCRKDGIPPSAGLRGYYLVTSNRIALFDVEHPNRLSRDVHDDRIHAVFSAENPMNRLATNSLPWAAGKRAGMIAGDVKDTMIHEATHQVAYNTGLHSRIGENPHWVVEGLATMFEAPAIRQNLHNLPPKARINPERYLRFRAFAGTRRKPKSLAAFIGSDSPFRTAKLDAYSQAWALSFFLLETRSAQYSRYLKTIATRDPFQPYTPERRLADFKQAFGPDLDWLEVQFLRFIERLK